MKVCGTCKQKYSDSLQYCLVDGTVLSSFDDQATLRIDARPTLTGAPKKAGLAIGTLITIIGGAIAIVASVAIIVAYSFFKPRSSETTSTNTSSSWTPTTAPAKENRPTSKDDVAKDLEQVNSEVAVSMVQDDIGSLDRLLADDYHYISDAGLSLNKTDVLNLFRSGNVHYDYLTTSDPTVEVESDLQKGVVSGHARSKGRLNNQPFTDYYLYKNSYEKRNGRWQLVEGISRHR